MSETFLIVAFEHRACQISCTIEKIRHSGDPAVAGKSDVRLVGAVGNAQYHKRQNTTECDTMKFISILTHILSK